MNATRNRRHVSRRPAIAAGLIAAMGLLAACGNSSDGDSPSSSPNGAVEGTLRMFTYDDTIDPLIMEPFDKAYPNVDVKTATFNSDAQAAAKIEGGFGTDVIEVCLDESSPLVDAGLLAPIDTKAVDGWDDLAPIYRDADGVTVDGTTWMVPLSAGPHGIIYVTSEFPEGVDSWTKLYDPALKGRVALDGGGSLTPMAVTALSLGITDPMNMTPEQITQVRDYMLEHRDQFRTFADSDSDMVNLFKSGEIVISDGGRGTATKLQEAGVDVTWVAPKEGGLSWVCGLGISSESENIPASYAMIEHFLSPPMQAVTADLGYAITNPKALPLIPADERESADPAALKNLIAEVEPANPTEWDAAWQEVQVG
ncbi:MAG TPA: extracellular solute-binding protein [Actinomycetes bacterium]|nr:extracellular solute-binding protein [Actinomycetes bacterium]